MPVDEPMCKCWGALKLPVPMDHGSNIASQSGTPIEYACDTCDGTSFYRKECYCEACVLFRSTRSNLVDSRDDWDPVAEYNAAVGLIQEELDDYKKSVGKELDDYKKKVEEMEMAQEQMARPARQPCSRVPGPVLYWDILTKAGPFIKVNTGTSTDEKGRECYYAGLGETNQLAANKWANTLTTVDPNAPEPVAESESQHPILLSERATPAPLPLVFYLFCLSALLCFSSLITALFVHSVQ